MLVPLSCAWSVRRQPAYSDTINVSGVFTNSSPCIDFQERHIYVWGKKLKIFKYTNKTEHSTIVVILAKIDW